MDLNTYKASLKRQVDALQQTRQELKLQLHLAKADAHDEWDKLEKSWSAVQGELKRIGEEAKQPIADMGKAAKGLIDELEQGYQRMRDKLRQ